MTAPLSPAELRRACGVSQQTVADALGVSPSTVDRWERGQIRYGRDRRKAWLRVQRGFRRHVEVTW